MNGTRTKQIETNCLPKRKSIRLKKYNYSLPNYYYVTICTQNRRCLFGEIINEKMKLNDIGKIIGEYWRKLPQKFNNVSLDEYVIMPNHLHGIIIIKPVGAPLVGARPVNQRAGIKPAPTGENNKTLGEIIGAFKSLTTNQYIKNVKNNHWPAFNKHLWQRNFYEHIIRNEEELGKIEQYIINNPQRWSCDTNNL